jgi:hypothetical protein
MWTLLTFAAGAVSAVLVSFVMFALVIRRVDATMRDDDC